MSRLTDPEIAYRAFQNHCATCASCRDQITPCPYGEHLLEAWGDSERWFAREQQNIEEVLREAAPEVETECL